MDRTENNLTPQDSPTQTMNVVDEAYQLELREFKGFWKGFGELLCISLPLLYIYTSVFGLISVQLHRSFFIAVCLSLTFLYNPFNKAKYSKHSPSLLDIILIILSFAFVGYFVHNYPSMAFKAGMPPSNTDIVFGIIAIIVCIEGCRRVLGIALPIITVVFIIYTLYGHLPFIPEMIRHAHVDLSRFIYFQYTTIEGMFGSVASVCATYVLMFIFLGAFLEETGAGDFFMNLSLALTGRSYGGPAKTAVIASGFFGSLSGSAVANTVATGTFTIPMMKKAGYKPEVAGAIEPVASTGGQFMPPVMGAGAFLMVEFTGIPYLRIMTVAIVPALLYFTSVYIMVHLEAKKNNIGGAVMEEKELPKAGEVMRDGWYYILIILLVVVLLVRGMSPQFSAFWAICATILTKIVNVLVKRESKETFWSDMYKALVSAGKSAIVIGASIGIIGVVVGCIFLTGIGIRFSSIVISLSHGILPLAVMMIALAATVIGMGATVTSSYIIVSVLAIPALTKLGVPLLAAHFIVFWFSQTSNITPPVCVAAFAGASIAGSHPMKTGFTALKYGSILYIMPFLFIYAPGILLEGTPFVVITTIISSLIAMYAFCGCIMGYLIRETTLVERLALGAAAVLLLKPGLITDTVGITLIAIVVLNQKKTEKKLALQ